MAIAGSTALAILTGVLTGAFTGFLTYWLARRQFITQRWWDLKVDAYTRIIEAAWFLLDYYGTHFDSAVGISRDISPERRKELEAKWDKGREEIKRAAVTGEFIVSKEAALRLREYLHGKRARIELNDWVGQIDEDYGRTKSMLDDLIVMVRRDLEIPDGKVPKKRDDRNKND